MKNWHLLDDADALIVADVLELTAAQLRQIRDPRRLPPAAWERVAESLRAVVQLARFHASDDGSVARHVDEDRETFVSVSVAGRTLGIGSRALTRRCTLGQVPGVRRADPQNPKSAWLIPSAYIAERMP